MNLFFNWHFINIRLLTTWACCLETAALSVSGRVLVSSTSWEVKQSCVMLLLGIQDFLKFMSTLLMRYVKNIRDCLKPNLHRGHTGPLKPANLSIIQDHTCLCLSQICIPSIMLPKEFLYGHVSMFAVPFFFLKP